MRYDVAIIGAGPAGLHCAQLLAKEGVRVIVLEKSKELGNKPCAGGLSAKTIRLGVPLKMTEKIISSCVFHYNSRKKVLNAKNWVATIPRQKLAKWQYQKAIETGAEIILDCRVEKIGEKKLITSKGEFGFNYLIGADGSNSMVRRALGLPIKRWLNTFYYELSMEHPQIEWFIEPRLFKNGFGWIFPYQGRITIGVGGHSDELEPKELLKRFSEWISRQGISPKNERIYSGLINVDYHGWKFENVFLVGDAAGLASPVTGEGIYSAIVSAEEVAKKILSPNYNLAHLRRLLRWWRTHNWLYSLLHNSLKLRDLFYSLIFNFSSFWPVKMALQKIFID